MKGNLSFLGVKSTGATNRIGNAVMAGKPNLGIKQLSTDSTPN